MSREFIYRDENVSFEYEPVGDIAVVHCDVTHYSPSIMRKWYKLFVQSKELLASLGFKEMLTISPNPRFCEMFCGKYVQSIDTPDGIREVYKWELGQK